MAQKRYMHVNRVTRRGPLNANARINPGFLEKCAILYNYFSGKGSEERDYEETRERTLNLPNGVRLGQAGQEALKSMGIRYSQPRSQQYQGDIEDKTLSPGLMNFPGNPEELTILRPEGNLSATHLREIKMRKEQLAGKQ